MVSAKRLVALAGVFAVAVWGQGARAQTCTPPTNWRPPLVYFCDDSPARASEVNANFRQVITWLEAKVGDAGQPTVLPAGTVTAAAILDGTITSAELAGGAVTGAHLADGGVTLRTIASPVTVYAINSHCADDGLLTTAPTCTYAAPSCGTCTVASAPFPRYRDCNDVCFTCNGMTVPPPPQVCTANNTVVGSLVR